MTPKQVLDALRAGNTEAITEQGDEGFRSNVSSEQMRQVWNDATADLGELVTSDEPVVVHDMPLQFTGGEAHLQVATGTRHGSRSRCRPTTAGAGRRVSKPDLVVWSSLWPSGPDAVIRLELPPDAAGQGTDLTWTRVHDR